MISQPWSPLWARVAGEANPRFVVTSLSRQEAGARRLHEKVYCARATWIAQLGVPSASWREVFVIVGAIRVGGTVFIRVTATATSPTDGENRGSSPLGSANSIKVLSSVICTTHDVPLAREFCGKAKHCLATGISPGWGVERDGASLASKVGNDSSTKLL